MSDGERSLIEWAKRREARFAESAAKEEAMRERTLAKLLGGLWHTSHPDRFKRILEMGFILPIPENPNPDGWKTMSGGPYVTYAHTLGGVSLFDFDQFDAEKYREECPLSTWETFVPFREKWGSSVWIEIDRLMVAPNLISGSALVERWKADNAYGKSLMPYIEAVHVGPLPRAAFKRAFLVGTEDDRFHELNS